MHLTPIEVKQKFGSLFAQQFLTLVDEANGIAEILETCAIRGALEWDFVNRLRAGGLIISGELQGNTLVMRAKIGTANANFGPVSIEQGGQALESVVIDEDTVKTSWAGIGGAGVGVAACLTQAPGVISAFFPQPDDLKIGGARINRVVITTPRYEKLTIGIDDTDNKSGGATWVLALKAAKKVAANEGIKFLDMRCIQLCPKSPDKTTNCVATTLVFAVKTPLVNELIKSFVEIIKAETLSAETGIIIYRGIGIPKTLNTFGWQAKKELVNLKMVETFVNHPHLNFIDLNLGLKKGNIGALAAIGLAEEKLPAAALDNDPVLQLISNK
jgi:methanogenesis imperfect marker protein 11